MQTRLKEELDADREENFVSVTDFKTGRNKYELYCGMCSKILYADKETFESVNRAIEQGLDNPFLCDDCRQEYNELQFAGR